ncbi:MFS transporter [Alkalibacter rhizosphaerae]|uniref:MFS transporter n=1 Tax=Alkalibacter rhizosphaerae TaxID=2815577 RepID=A0A974XI56_9FIRM|nr:MFS transporter [Alkalibacter rhizosphaerae]QSX09125.1 MFS transporter [Alkalibacter rhizosphaerae]
MKKTNIKLAILSLSAIVMVSMTASAILADIAAHYPDVDLNTVQMVLAVPSLLSMFFALLSGPLSGKISKKSLVLFGLISGFAGGMIGLTLGTVHIALLIFASVLIGVSQGINSTMTMALIADYFSGNERGAMMGLQSAFVNGGSMAILFASGLLAGIQWNMSYLVYLLFVPVILIVWRYLPKDNQKHEMMEEDADGKMNAVVYFHCIVMMLFAMLIFIYQSNIAMFISSNHLGNASTAGFINSFGTGIGMVTGIFFGRIKNLLKDKILPIAMSLMGLGMLGIYFVGTIEAVILASFFNGFAMSSIIPTVMFNVSSAVSAAKSSNAIALANGSMSIGMFMSPFVMNSFAESLRPGVLEFKFFISAVGLVVLAFVILTGNYILANGEAIKTIKASKALQE